MNGIGILLSAVLFSMAVFSYLRWDRGIAAWHKSHPKKVYKLWKVPTFFGYSQVWLIPLVPLWGYAVWKGWAVRKEILFFVLSIAVSGIAADVLKFIFGRCRPQLWFREQKYGFTFFKFTYKYISFPSGHAATGLSFGFAGMYLYPDYTALWLFSGALVAYSRVALAKHYFSDVLVGGWIGAVSSVYLYSYLFA